MKGLPKDTSLEIFRTPEIHKTSRNLSENRWGQVGEGCAESIQRNQQGAGFLSSKVRHIFKILPRFCPEARQPKFKS
jgi:hypothetical protein